MGGVGLGYEIHLLAGCVRYVGALHCTHSAVKEELAVLTFKGDNFAHQNPLPAGPTCAVHVLLLPRGGMQRRVALQSAKGVQRGLSSTGGYQYRGL